MAFVPSLDTIKTAFNSVVKQAGFRERIEWWLVSPHAAERWLQFELAFSLQRACSDELIVACEVSRADIVIFDRPEMKTIPVWNNSPAAKLELKMIGNWCVSNDQFQGIIGDIDKVDRDSTPSLALVFCAVFGTSEEGVRYNALVKQISGCGTPTSDDVEAKLNNELKKHGFELKYIDYHHVADFELPRHFAHLSFHLFGHANGEAGGLLESCPAIRALETGGVKH